MSETESNNHLFIACRFSVKCLTGFSIGMVSLFLPSNLVNFVAHWGNCPKSRRIIITIIYGFLWCMWKNINDKVFNRVHPLVPKKTDFIITTVFNWIKFKGNYKYCNWANWVNFPFKLVCFLLPCLPLLGMGCLFFFYIISHISKKSRIFLYLLITFTIDHINFTIFFKTKMEN